MPGQDEQRHVRGRVLLRSDRAASTATANGKAITVSASCTNLAGMTAHASVELKIDQTRPKVTVTRNRFHYRRRAG